MRELSNNYRDNSSNGGSSSSNNNNNSGCSERGGDAEESVVGGDWPVVGVGRVPILLHGAGVLYRRFFDESTDHFQKISTEHEFQTLTESNKPGRAYRTGIYLTPVRPDPDGNRHFRLLRCSTNLSGPTDNFKSTDHAIVDALNLEVAGLLCRGCGSCADSAGAAGNSRETGMNGSACVEASANRDESGLTGRSGGGGGLFDNAAPLNHVLAQIYWNSPATATTKMVKARIAAHADKTKDMPENGIMAFCTFYSGLEDKLQPCTEQSAGVGADTFDWGYRGQTSGLTRLQFRLKRCISERAYCPFVREFSVTLYPNSVFFMPLCTNRLYTHEIRPAVLNAEQLPTRLGYVVRCSSTEAVFCNERTCIKIPCNQLPRTGSTTCVNSDGGAEDAGMVAKTMTISGNDFALVELQPQTQEGVRELRAAYREENSSADFIDYGHRFLFSMNKGDYSQPGYSPRDEFRQYDLPRDADLSFESLGSSVHFEEVCKGRQGTVLVRPNRHRGTPIVRTTTKYVLCGDGQLHVCRSSISSESGRRITKAGFLLINTFFLIVDALFQVRHSSPNLWPSTEKASARYRNRCSPSSPIKQCTS